ncbi:Scd6-like Sm domain-containing protein [Hyaloscypha sp. PMI_1271]|nr:Scd6-like Sm domain-containing protein [Hyaloscypha sp. PMI_1271]
MTEFIGARISLISKSDIRYVGTLHEINSETSTVALENVSSFGTESRKTDPKEVIPPSDSVYEYIVFRGSDVKDLRIEETPAARENIPPQVPNDPAILGSGTRPPPQAQPSQQRQQQGPQQPGPAPPGVPAFGHHPQYPPAFYPPGPPGGWGRGGPPGPAGFPPMPYGPPPPGWFPGPGQGFPPGPFPGYGGFPPGQQGYPPQQQGQPSKPAPIGPGAHKQPTPPAAQTTEKQPEPKSLAQPAAEMAAGSVTKVPTPPVASKPSPSEIQAAVSQQPSTSNIAATAPAKPAPTGPKIPGRVQPVIPLQSPAANKSPPRMQQGNVVPAAKPADDNAARIMAATQAATAAVAAAMAKLPPAGQTQTNGSAVDNLTRKVNEMRTTDPIRAPRHPGGAGFVQTRGRGGRGGGQSRAAPTKDVPTSDFDFESSNAKFSKEDLVKEAIAGSPIGENPPDATSPTESAVQTSGYNKSTSFFDNISSEAKERMEGGGNRPGGREWRGEEQKKNLETFGQGSVDNGYRGGYRGRGRGRGGYRGRGYSGNGQPGRGRGGYRGRGDAQTTVQ